jgi:hypothetical protein
LSLRSSFRYKENKRSPLKFSAHLLRFASLCALVAAVHISCAPFAQAQTPSAPPTPDSAASSSSDDAAAKAAARKKRFEDTKKSLEEKAPEPPPQKPEASKPSAVRAVPSPPAPYESPVFTIDVNMFVGETQRFALFDDARRNLTSNAYWTVSDPSIADLSVAGGVPSVVGKKSGTVNLLAHVNSMTAQVLLTVLDRDRMSATVTRWTQASDSSQALLQIVPAVPIMAKRP